VQFIVRSKKPDLRIDLQGFRGVGILLVVIGHLWANPSGAFAALDVFFTISGYFITSILIGKHLKTGTVHFKDFYAARMRRLFPTAFVTIVVALILTDLLYSGTSAHSLLPQGFFAAVFASNWYFIHNSTNYFTSTQSSPFLHYWSLSVEEQFYLFWPLFIFVVLRLVRRFRLNPTRALVVAFSIVTVVFFSYSLWHSSSNPTAAYFSTFDRVWEFSIGGLVALGRPLWKRIPGGWATLINWVSTIVVLATFFTLTTSMTFPAPIGLIPVLGISALIISGISPGVKATPIVTNVVFVYLGNMSYSLYLWHLPINYLLRSYFIQDTTTYKFVALGTALVVGSISYHLLEYPLRFSPALMTAREKRHQSKGRTFKWRNVRIGWVVVLALITIVSVGTTLRSTGDVTPVAQTYTDTGTSSTTGTSHTSSGSKTVASTALQKQILAVQSSLAATSFPDFNPSLKDTTPAKLTAEWSTLQCVDVTLATASSCSFAQAGATKTAIVIGDSHAISFVPGIRRALEPEGWRVQQFTYLGCPAWTLPDYEIGVGASGALCNQHHQQALQELQSLKPDMIIVMTASQAESRVALAQSHANQKGEALAASALGKTLKLYKPYTKRLVVLGDGPGHVALPDCVTKFSKPSDCVSKIDSSYTEYVAGEKSAAKTYGADYISTENWFCFNGNCPGFIGTIPATADGEHMTVALAQSLGPVLRDAILGTPTKKDATSKTSDSTKTGTTKKSAKKSSSTTPAT
jgi:peptidoglycan/LPS O-acetylase OafA/YrhL